MHRADRDRKLTPEEATRNVDPNEVVRPPADWTRADFLRELKSNQHRQGRERPQEDGPVAR